MKFKVERIYPGSDLIINGSELYVSESGAVSILSSGSTIAVFPTGTTIYSIEDLDEEAGAPESNKNIPDNTIAY